jgi:hypothetical protein
MTRKRAEAPLKMEEKKDTKKNKTWYLVNETLEEQFSSYYFLCQGRTQFYVNESGTITNDEMGRMEKMIISIYKDGDSKDKT